MHSKYLCEDCLDAFEVSFYIRKIHGVEVLSLYAYNETFKGALYRYKAKGDIELSAIFLINYRYYLRLKYSGYYLVPAPSTTSSDEGRGFNHVIEAFKILKLPVIECAIKTEEFKQSDLNYQQRQEVKSKLSIIDGGRLSNKYILLVDDLFTTGATMKALIELVKIYHPKSIKVLTLAFTKSIDK